MSAADCKLRPMRPEWVDQLATELSMIDTWLRLGFGKQKFSVLLSGREPDVTCLAIIQSEDHLSGVVILRHRWLFGPYLRIFGVLPSGQGQGIGAAAMNLLCDQLAASGEENLWACVSAFNKKAIAFYEGNGFEVIGCLEELVVPNEDELLIRKRLIKKQSA